MTPNVIVWDNIRVPWHTHADKDTLTQAVERALKR